MLCFVAIAPVLRANFQDSIEGKEGLSFLVGDWTSHETTKGKDGKEVPFDLIGHNRWILEGSMLQMDESFEVPGDGKFGNHILMSYDSDQKTYRAWWFANTTPKPLVFTGVRATKTFVLTAESGRLRISYDLLEPGHYKAAVAVKRGETWSDLTVAEYKRTKE